MRTRLISVRVLAENDGDVAHQILLIRLIGSQFLVDLRERDYRSFDALLRPVQRRTLGQQKTCLDDIAIDIGEADKLELAAGRHGDTQDQQHQHQPQREIAIVHGQIQRSTEPALAQVIETAIECRTKTLL